MYDGADRAIRAMNRRNLKLFQRLKQANWDELNVIRQISQAYDESSASARQYYYQIAADAFASALLAAGISAEKTPGMTDEYITMLWVMEMLTEPDPVTKYEFVTETERKKQRLAEAMSVSSARGAEVDMALRYWTLQVAQYADNSVYRARLAAFRAAGVEYVRWVTQDDDRVCKECDDLNMLVFPIDRVPPPQHYHCRCELWPA